MSNAQERVQVANTSATVSKLDRYKWELRDRPGEFQMIPKGDLIVDHDVYQRLANKQKVLAIVKDWSWVACGAILVARRSTGKLYIMDGQHRKVAADNRSDIAKLPCMVFDVLDIESEAKGFLGANTLRKPMRSDEKFKAQIACGDPVALKAHALIEASGRSVGGTTGPNTFNALTSLMRCISEDNAAIERIWPLLVNVSLGTAMHNKLMEGLFYIETHLENQSLTDKKLSARVMSVGHDALLEGANKASAYYARGGAKIFAEGILNAINYRSRTQILLP